MEVCLSEHEIVLSDNLPGEILTNLRRKIKLPENLINRTGTLLREHARFSTLVSLAADVCRDPDDIKGLGLAVASNADYFVTGDKDLLILKRFQNIPILTPRSFSDILHGAKKYHMSFFGLSCRSGGPNCRFPA